MFDELKASTRRLLSRRASSGGSPGSIDAVRESLKRAAPEGDRLARANVVGPEVSDAVAHARARMREMLRKEGVLGWVLAPFAGAIAYARARLASLRSNMSYVATGVRLLSDEAATLMTVAVLAGATVTSSLFPSTPAFANEAASKSVAAYRSSGDSSAVASTHASGRNGMTVGNAGALSAAIAQPRSRTGASVGIHRDRRVNVTDWAWTWVPVGQDVSHQDATWISCNPNSAALMAACAAYDQLPRGPQ